MTRPRPPRTPWPKWAKWLVGCLALLALLAVLAFAGMLLGFWWAFSTPEQLETAQLIGEETLLVVRGEGDLEDPGVSATADLVLSEITRMQQEAAGDVPAGIRMLMELQGEMNKMSLRGYLPRELAFLEEQLADDDEHAMVGLINLRTMPRMYGRMFEWVGRLETGDGGPTVIHHRDRAILSLGEGEGFLCFAGGSVLFGSHVEALQRVLDRVDAAAPSGELYRRFVGLEGREDGQTVVDVQRARLADSPRFGELLGAARESGCTHLEATVDVASVDRWLLAAELECPDSDGVEVERLERALDEIAEAQSTGGLKVTAAARRSDSTVTLRLDVTGVGDAIRGRLWGAAPEPAPEVWEVADPDGRDGGVLPAELSP